MSPFTAESLLRRQISVTGQFRVDDDTLSPSYIPAPPPLLDEATAIVQAWLRFVHLQPVEKPSTIYAQFMPAKLILAMIKCAPSEQGKQNTISEALFTLVGNGGSDPLSISSLEDLVGRTRNWRDQSTEILKPAVARLQMLGKEILDCLLLPLKACGYKTPAVRLVISQGLRARHAPDQDQGTFMRLEGLRNKLMARDGCRCVVSGLLDYSQNRNKSIDDSFDLPDNFGDVDEEPDDAVYEQVEGAHILPHALNSISEGFELDKKSAHVWTVANIFCPGLSDLVMREQINGPQNGMLLTHNLHVHFGALRLWFTATDQPNEYVVGPNSVLSHSGINSAPGRHLVRFEDHSGKQISLPNPRLLAFHRACCLVLRASGAGDYIEEILDKFGRIGVLSSDGSSTEMLDHILHTVAHSTLVRWD